MEAVKAKIRDIPDFPKLGIIFKDLTPVLADSELMRQIIDGLSTPYRCDKITAVAGIEARGFIFGSLVAQALEVGFIPLRKQGKLPAAKYSVSYDLEYGQATLEMHKDIINSGDRILLVDDLIATGGTASAGCQLIEMAGGKIAGCAFVVELAFLAGRRKLEHYDIQALIQY